MSKLTWSQREDRRTARRYGDNCRRYIEQANGRMKEAGLWKPISEERAAFWAGLSDEALEDAVKYGRWAMRAARNSLDEVAEAS